MNAKKDLIKSTAGMIALGIFTFYNTKIIDRCEKGLNERRVKLIEFNGNKLKKISYSD